VTRRTRIWLGAFALWSLFLSGAVASVIGSPGVLQLFRLRGLLDSRESELGRLEAEIHRLQTEAGRLGGSKVLQQREIRRVLGYAAPDEIVFDFRQTPD
jgi:cell division protein FtsB